MKECGYMEGSRDCSLTMLVWRRGKIRLMQLRSDPTAKQDEYSLHLFDGCLEFDDISVSSGQGEQSESSPGLKKKIRPDLIKAV